METKFFKNFFKHLFIVLGYKYCNIFELVKLYSIYRNFMFGNPYTLFVFELCKHCGEPSPSSSQVGTISKLVPKLRGQNNRLIRLGLFSL